MPMYTPSLTLEALEARHLLAGIDGSSEETHEPKSATIEDDEALRSVLNLIDAETENLADESAADDDESHSKKSKNPLKRLKHKVDQDVKDLKHALGSKTAKLHKDLEASLDKLEKIAHIDEIKAELGVIKEKLGNETDSLREDLSHGLDRLKDGASGAKEKLIPILDLPAHLLDQFTDPGEIFSNLAYLAKIIKPGSDDGDNSDEAYSVDEKVTIGNKVGDFMHHRVDKLQSRTDHFVNLLEKMPEGQSKHLLMQTLGTLADAMGTVVGKISDFNENHSEINEKRLNRMIFEAHVGSKLLKYGSWGLKVSSGVLKLVSLAVPEAIPAGLAAGVAGGFVSVGSDALNTLEGDLPHLASEKSKVVTGAAEAGHRAEDVWHKLGSRLKDAGTVEEQQAALEEAMEAIAV